MCARSPFLSFSHSCSLSLSLFLVLRLLVLATHDKLSVCRKYSRERNNLVAKYMWHKYRSKHAQPTKICINFQPYTYIYPITRPKSIHIYYTRVLCKPFHIASYREWWKKQPDRILCCWALHKHTPISTMKRPNAMILHGSSWLVLLLLLVYLTSFQSVCSLCRPLLNTCVQIEK